jgi:hypothetical protein
MLGTVRIMSCCFTAVFGPSSSLSALLLLIIVQVGHGEGAGQTSVKMVVATLTVARCHSDSSCIKMCVATLRNKLKLHKASAGIVILSSYTAYHGHA